ncbi:MAG: GNAT family N-acetyltransferase [Elusimicrobia bacterium]|nr:GNAT family N-acetyltransferase [Elusimicrobiota bacterium]
MVSAGVAWRVVGLEEAAARWDEWLSAFEDRHLRQTFAWGRHKAGSWTVEHTALLNGPTPMALGLCLTRALPLGAATVAWLNGGPVFRRKRPRDQDLASLEKYLEGLQEHLAPRRPMLRVSPAIAMDLDVQLALRQAGFARPLAPISSGLTYILDLALPLEELHARLERNWRNQLRAAEKAGAELAWGRAPELLERYLPLHNALVERKGLAGQRLSAEDLRGLVDTLGERITFVVLSVGGEDGCGGAVWTCGDRAWMGLSAANALGLKHNLPNLMYWRLVERLKASGARSFDLTGIDPKENWGVFNFKRGLRAAPVEQVGEWDWSPSDWRRRAFNLALWARGGDL